MQKQFRIGVCPPDRHYWVVRAHSGQFSRHFLQDSIVAIGHIDEMGLSESSPLQEQLEPKALTKYFQSVQTDLDQPPKKGTIAKFVNQVTTFVSTMKVGDWIVTLNSSTIFLGRITGEAYLSKDPIFLPAPPLPQQPPEPLYFRLRRKVKWAYRFPRNSLPANLQFTLGAHQTVFTIDDYRNALYHLIYPAFIDKDNLYFGANVTTNNAVETYALSKYLESLNQIEAVSKVLASTSEQNAAMDFNKDSIEQITEDFAERNELALSAKAEFNSPGFIMGCIGISMIGITALPYFLIIYAQKHGFVLENVELFKVFKIGKLTVSGKPASPQIAQEIQIKAKNAAKQLTDERSKRSIDKLQIQLPDLDPGYLDADSEPNVDSGYIGGKAIDESIESQDPVE